MSEKTLLPYGAKLRDNDPRMNGRVVTVTGSRDQPRIYVMDGAGRYFKISRSRIYTDGKPRRSGFSLVGAARSAVRARHKAGTLSDEPGL